MHRQKGQCSDLIEKTAAALDEDTLQLMLLAVQRDNLELSVKAALNRWVYQLTIKWLTILTNVIAYILVSGSSSNLQRV